MRYAVIFALFCAFIGVAAPIVVERYVIKIPQDHAAEKEILEDLSNLREGARLGRLLQDIRLDCAAQNHADDMMFRRTCTTVGQGGQTPRVRVESCGVGEFHEVAALVFCNAEWDMGRMLDKFPDHQQILRMAQWKYIGIGVRETYYVIYLTY